MTDHGDFGERIERADVPVYAMHRGRASLARTYWNLYRLFREIEPAIVHTRNLSGLDALLPAACAGVGVRIHGEHGRDMHDLDGTNPRYRRLKRLFKPLVTQYTTVSADLAEYLQDGIGVPASRIRHICNGVDTRAFRPAARASAAQGDDWVVGTVGRLQPVKDQISLVKAFAAALALAPAAMRTAKLLIVGEGPSRPDIEQAIAGASLQDRVSLLGSRNDVAEVLRGFDVFVLPSLAEGISNTILEAMATGLPVIATRTGGNAELVQDAQSGALVNVGDWQAMGRHIAGYACDRSLAVRHGGAARERAEREFSLEAMVEKYAALYDEFARPRSRRETGAEVRPASY
jgi:sugar transferase (PEP-CTERM/EpsH1 system associated)